MIVMNESHSQSSLIEFKLFLTDTRTIIWRQQWTTLYYYQYKWNTSRSFKFPKISEAFKKYKKVQRIVLKIGWKEIVNLRMFDLIRLK